MEDIIDIIVTETTNLIEITSQPTDEIIDVNIIDNREDVTLNVTPNVVEININSLTGNFGVNWGEIDGTLSNQTDLQNALNLKADLVGGKVPSSQLPSYVDDVVEVANYAALPATGETGKIYVTIDTNYIYRWTGSTYVEIKDSSAVWGAITGTLSNQTDLQNALNAKLSTSTAASTYVPYTGATGNVNLGLDYSLTAALIIKSGGTSTQFLKADGSIDTNTYATTSQLHNPVTLGTANGLSLSTQVLSLGLASSSSNGALSSTDWITFNGKQNALSGTGFVKISGTTISYDNSTYLTTSAASSTYVSGSGTTNYLPRWSSSKVLTDSFIYTNGNYTEIQGQGLTASMGIVVSGRYGSVANAPKIYSSDETTGVTHIELVNGGGEIRIGVEKSTGGQILPGSSAYATVLTAGLSGRNLEFGTNNTKRLTIDGSTGAATFTSSVTASSHIVPGGTSSQFLKANGTLDSTAYLPLSGGTLTGALSGTSATFTSSGISVPLEVKSTTTNYGRIRVSSTTSTAGNYRGYEFSNGSTFRGGLVQDESTEAISIFTPIGGQSFTLASSGAATFSSSVTADQFLSTNNGNGTNFKVGDDVWIGDINVANTMIVKGQQDATVGSIKLGTGGGTLYGYNNNVGIGTSSPAGKLLVQLPAYTNEDADANHAIFGSGTNGYGVRIGYSESGNSGYINVLKPSVAWSTLNIQTGTTIFNQAGVEQMRINTSGVKFKNGASYLTAYEEGTWTPIIGQADSNPSVSYSVQTGSYTRIGNLVTAFFDVTVSSKSGGSGTAVIRGLPFTVSTSMAGYSVIQWRSSDLMYGYAGVTLKGYAERGQTLAVVQLDYNGGAGNYGYAANGSYNASGRATGYITYTC